MEFVRIGLALLLAMNLVARAQPIPEGQLFAAAGRAFQDGLFDRAERDLGEFIRLYPDSPKTPEAVLLQGQARFRLGQFDRVIELLSAQAPKAGALADQYRFWIAEAQFARADFKSAEAAYAQLLADFPNSNQRLAAALGLAQARFNLGDAPGAVELLRQTNGPVQLAAQARPMNELASRGLLLLAEALLAKPDAHEAEGVLRALTGQVAAPELQWRQQYLLARALVLDQRGVEAMQLATNLVAVSASATQRAESVALQAQVLDQLQQPAAAIAVWEQNLTDAVPTVHRRQALLKIVDLLLAQNQTGAAVERLNGFASAHAGDALMDLVRLTMGELRLREARALKQQDDTAGSAAHWSERTNLLAQAHAQFNQLLADFPASVYAPKALLDRGWCFWEENRPAEAVVPFREAAPRLTAAEDQAQAVFKWADCLAAVGDHSGAVKQYRAVLDLEARAPALRAQWHDQTLHQIARASLDSGDVSAAQEAMRRLLQDNPQSPLADRTMLAVGQRLIRAGQPSEAREVLSDLAARFGQSPLLPEAALALARTYTEERKWDDAIKAYESWLTRFTNHAAAPQAEFDRAWVHYQAGRATNAYALFTNFVALHATSRLAPQAQYWVARHHFDRGDYAAAELNFQLLYQNTNWPADELSAQARMMAGRAAFARQSYKDAKEYFLGLVTNGPPAIVPEALFALGDTLIEESTGAQTNLLDRTFGEAINAFSRITNSFPTNRLALLAVGRIGDCHLQLASQDPKRYDSAAECYQRLMDSAADAATRSLAAVGLGRVLENRALLRPAAEQPAALGLALDRYLDVVYGKNLREGESADPFWVREAGLAAARLLEAQGRWAEAVRVYQRLKELLPAMSASLDRKIAQAQARAGGAR